MLTVSERIRNVLLLYSGLKAVFSQYKVVSKDQSTRDNLACTIENEDPKYEVCISHRILRTWEQQED